MTKLDKKNFIKLLNQEASEARYTNFVRTEMPYTPVTTQQVLDTQKVVAERQLDDFGFSNPGRPTLTAIINNILAGMSVEEAKEMAEKDLSKSIEGTGKAVMRPNETPTGDLMTKEPSVGWYKKAQEEFIKNYENALKEDTKWWEELLWNSYKFKGEKTMETWGLPSFSKPPSKIRKFWTKAKNFINKLRTI